MITIELSCDILFLRRLMIRLFSLVPFTTKDILHSVDATEKGLAFRKLRPEMFTKNRVEVITTTLFSALKLYTLPFLSDRV